MPLYISFTHQLYFGLANMNQIKHILKKLPKQMDLEKFLRTIRVNETFEQSEMAERLINDALEGAEKGLIDLVAIHLPCAVQQVSLCCKWLG